VTTAALAVPILLLRKQQRAAALANSLRESSVPPRRAGAVSRPLIQISPLLAGTVPAAAEHVARDSASFSSISLDAIFYAAKTFSIATVLVAAGSATTLWGIRSILGVQDVRIHHFEPSPPFGLRLYYLETKEFGKLMRYTLATKLPGLSSQIRRPLDLTEVDAASSDSGVWSWPAAEARLKEAFEKGGYSGWAQAAFAEMEAEVRAERIKRQNSRAGQEH
jgi:hypothetical protein